LARRRTRPSSCHRLRFRTRRSASRVRPCASKGGIHPPRRVGSGPRGPGGRIRTSSGMRGRQRKWGQIECSTFRSPGSRNGHGNPAGPGRHDGGGGGGVSPDFPFEVPLRRVGFRPPSGAADPSGGGGGGAASTGVDVATSGDEGAAGTTAGAGSGGVAGAVMGSGEGGATCGGGVATGTGAGAEGAGAGVECSPWWVGGADGRGVMGVNSPGFQVCGILRMEGSFKKRSAWPHERQILVPSESSPRARSESEPPPSPPVFRSFAHTNSDAPQLLQTGATRFT